MQSKFVIIKLLVILGVALSSTIAMAQIEEVLVTAQKRSESVQDVPISITAFSGEELTRRGIIDVQGIAQSVPNFDIPKSNNSRNVSIRIRGIGSSGTNPGIESSVGVFLDGLYQPTGAMAFGELADIESFEILRGPQGTLYGRNTPVGALNVTTRKPSDEFESKITLGAGEYASVWGNGYVGGSLSDNSAGRLSFWYRDREGYENNLLTGDDVNDHNTWGLRGKLLYQLSDSVEVNITANYSEIEKRCCMGEQLDVTGPFGIATPGFLAAQEAAGLPFVNFDDSDHVVDGDDEGDDNTETLGFSVQVDWDLDNEFLLTSITGYQDWENDVTIAADSLKNDVLTSNQVQANEIFSQELRITSPGNRDIEYLAGLFLYGQDTTYDSNAIIGPGANRVLPVPSPPCSSPCVAQAGDSAISFFDQETRSVAAYGNLTWHLTDQWDVTGGLRWSRDKKDAFISHTNAPGNGFVVDNLFFPPNEVGDLDLEEDSTTWSLNTRYNITEEVMIFATASTGFKSGGFNSRRLPVGAEVEFENEDSITFDAGIKSTWLDRRVLLNETLYHTTLENFQESTLAPTGTGFIVGNAGEQEAKGIELDFTINPIEPLTINGSLAVLDAEYTDFEDAQCGLGEPADNPDTGTCDRTGETPSFAPELQWGLGVEWAQPINDTELEWPLRADYSWVDAQNLLRVSQYSGRGQVVHGLPILAACVLCPSGGGEL